MSRHRIPAMGLAALLAGCAGESLRDFPVSIDRVFPKQVSARGGAVLTLEGEGFTGETTVALGGAPAAARRVSGQQLAITAPPMWAGPADLVVTTELGESATLRGGIEVLPMALRFVETPPFEAGAAITSLAPGDFDHDGDADLLVCGPAIACRLLLNDGRANFERLPTAATDAGSADAGRADAGRVDAGVADAGRVDAGTPDGGGPRLSALIGAQLLGAADLDGDGRDDLLITRPDAGGVLAFAGLAGAGVDVIPPNPADAGPLQPITAFAVADFDHDGKLDLISAGATPQLGAVRVDLNASGPFGRGFTAGPRASLQPWALTAVTVADVDGDGAPELVLSTTGTDGPALRLFVHRAGVLSEVPGGLPSVTGGPWAALAAGDVDGDGSIDLVAVGPGQDRLLINDGKGHFFDATASALPIDGSKGTSLAMVDLDRDRDLDLVIGNASAAMRLYVNDGAGKFLDRTPALPVRSDSTASVCAANLDGDGDLDLVVLGGGVPRLNLSVEPR